jgi:structural maintenance of chromosome 4
LSEMPPRRAARAASSKTVADSPPESDAEPSRKRRVNKRNLGNADDGSDAAPSPPEDNSDEEAFQDKKPAKKMTKVPAKRAPAAAKGKAKATTTKAKAKAVRALADEDDATESQVDATEDEPSVPKKAAVKGKGKAKTPAPKGFQAPPTPAPVTDTEDDEPLDEAPSFHTPRPKEKRVAAPVELDEEDNIVLEPPTPRPPPVFSPAKPTQPDDTGPKPRLVIHKLALVNFKSYAGRQEIGPFHKVNR